MSAVVENMRERAVGFAIFRIRVGKVCSLRDALICRKLPLVSEAQAQLLYSFSRGIGAEEVLAIPHFDSLGMGLLWFGATPRHGDSETQFLSDRKVASRTGAAGKDLQQPLAVRSVAPLSDVAHKVLH